MPKTTINYLSGSVAELLISLDKDELKRHDDAVHAKLSSDTNVPGFRKGNIPKMILLQHVGHEKYNQELLEFAINESVIKALEEHRLVPIAPPEITVQKFVPGELLEFKGKVSLMPKIELSDYKKIKVKSEEVKIQDEEVDGVVKDLQKRSSNLITKKAEEQIEKGDRVEIDFDASQDGKTIERGSSKNHPLVVGENIFIPGFEDQLLGLKTNGEKEFDLSFPKDYHEKSLAGKPTRFKVKVNLVQKVELPALDDDFAKRFGPYKTFAELKEHVKKNLLAEKQLSERSRLINEIVGKIIKDSKIDLPDVLIDKEAENIKTETEQKVAAQGMELAKYLEAFGKTVEEYEKDSREMARDRIAAYLVLHEIGKLEDIKVSDEEVDAYFLDARLENPTDENKESAKAQLQSEKTIDFLINTCSSLDLKS